MELPHNTRLKAWFGNERDPRWFRLTGLMPENNPDGLTKASMAACLSSAYNSELLCSVYFRLAWRRPQSSFFLPHAFVERRVHNILDSNWVMTGSLKILTFIIVVLVSVDAGIACCGKHMVVI